MTINTQSSFVIYRDFKVLLACFERLIFLQNIRHLFATRASFSFKHFEVETVLQIVTTIVCEERQ